MNILSVYYKILLTPLTLAKRGLGVRASYLLTFYSSAFFSLLFSLIYFSGHYLFLGVLFSIVSSLLVLFFFSMLTFLYVQFFDRRAQYKHILSAFSIPSSLFIFAWIPYLGPGIAIFSLFFLVCTLREHTELSLTNITVLIFFLIVFTFFSGNLLNSFLGGITQ
ncbi:MAG: hypothetical protein KC548_04455 [Nanoarchaeota archaeon]|nr:hypothetical protein [Nanoarchaeota archaeon]